MPTRDTNWPAGTPNWVDCCFDDVKKAGDFYAKLFGWDVQEGPAEMGGYALCFKHGRSAAAITPRMAPEVPTAWSTFFASDDVDATAEAVRAAGGSVIAEPMGVAGAGRMAFFTDVEGAAFGAWQGGEHHGFGIFNESGSVGWNDLMTRDLEGAKAFYGKVFGFSYDEVGADYVTCKRASDGEVVAGIHLAGHLPDEVPANWLTHFVVADRDSSVAIVEELDGEVLMSFDTPFGPEATIRGPEGEVFNVISYTAEAEEEAEHDRDAE